MGGFKCVTHSRFLSVSISRWGSLSMSLNESLARLVCVRLSRGYESRCRFWEWLSLILLRDRCILVGVSWVWDFGEGSGEADTSNSQLEMSRGIFSCIEITLRKESCWLWSWGWMLNVDMPSIVNVFTCHSKLHVLAPVNIWPARRVFSLPSGNGLWVKRRLHYGTIFIKDDWGKEATGRP